MEMKEVCVHGVPSPLAGSATGLNSIYPIELIELKNKQIEQIQLN